MQISEAVQINGTRRENLINNKSEWNYVSLPRCMSIRTEVRIWTLRIAVELDQLEKNLSFRNIELDRWTANVLSIIRSS